MKTCVFREKFFDRSDTAHNVVQLIVKQTLSTSRNKKKKLCQTTTVSPHVANHLLLTKLIPQYSNPKFSMQIICQNVRHGIKTP